MRYLLAFIAVGLVVDLCEAAGLEELRVSVRPTEELGPVKDMHAVNNGPSVKYKSADDQMRGNFEDYRSMRTPFARTHDSINCVPGGAHTVDITAVFPNFDADETDLSNYDFAFTDAYLDTITAAGTEVFYRLGQTIEHGVKKYGIYPPKDYAKWARICEQIILRYKDRNHIRYWEIWNEPDLGWWDWQKNPRTWGGTPEAFYEFFGVAARALKAKFPELKIGGPALAGDEAWADRFLGYCETNSVPLDFFSWHIYSVEPSEIAEKATRMRALMDKHGYTKAESILNEWNYVKGWTGDYVYSVDTICGEHSIRGAAFTTATMIACQDRPVDMLMYYDARISTIFNGLFDRVALRPIKGYYAIYAWSRLKDFGTQVKVSVPEGKGLYATAVKGKDGKVALLLARYSSDNNVTSDINVRVTLEGRPLGQLRAHVTDSVRSHTEVLLFPNNDGTVTVRLQPTSFALLEF